MGRTLELATDSPEETRAVGRAVGRLLRPRDVVSLTGDLGAGKTTFVQGAAAALDVREPVLSPTFTLIREYQGQEALRIYHLDVYRLDRLQDVLDLGFDEILDQGGVVFIEWGDVIDALLPDDHLQLEIQLSGDDDASPPPDERRLRLWATGDSWARRWPGLVEATRLWQVASRDAAGGQG